MLLLSARTGALAQRIGPRLPMTIGPVGVAAGLVLWSRVDAGSAYLTGVLPGAIVFGLGLSLTVAPPTAPIMAAAEPRLLVVAHPADTAVARAPGLPSVGSLVFAQGP